MSLRTALLFSVTVLFTSAGIAAEPDDTPASAPAAPAGSYFRAKSINPDLPDPNAPVNLATPQACLEHFVRAGRREQWMRAAHTMNFELLSPVTPREAAARARQLHYLIRQNLWIDWSLVPDRPDAIVHRSMLNGSSGQGRARRSIRIGSIAFDGRDVPIRLERIKPEDGDPVWLFSAQTVDNIDRLYAAKGPSWLARQAPEWSRTRLLGNVPLWQWLALAVLLGLSVLTAWLVIKVLSQQLASHLGRRGRRFVENIRWPAAILTTALVGYSSVGSLLTLPGGVATVASPLVLAVMIFSATWLCVRVLGFFSESVTQNMLQDGPSIDESGTLVRLTVFRYVLVLLIVAIGLSVLLISIDMFRTVGIALLGSAGAAAVVLGIAGHAVLGNLIAGVQIALARPFRIGDTVIVEGYWGRIEEVRYTYVAVRTWDQKRVILPVRYFLNHYFENWSKTDPFLVKPIYLKVDYRADVQAIREKFMEIVRQDEDWAEDRDDPDVLVIECGDETITIRLTCGGSDSPSAWRLVCRVREKLVAWLQDYEDGRFLPRQRLVLHQGSQWRSENRQQADPRPTHAGGDEDGGQG